MTTANFEKITITSSNILDNLPLPERFDILLLRNKAKNPYVIALHSFGKSKEFNFKIAEFLNQLKFNVVLMDFPLHGDRLIDGKDIWSFGQFSAKLLSEFFKRAVSDIISIADFLSIPSLFLWGVSLGGIVSMLASAKDDRFKKVFTALASADLLDSIKGMKNLPRIPQPFKAGLWLTFSLLNLTGKINTSPFQSIMKLAKDIKKQNPETLKLLNEVNPMNFINSLEHSQKVFLFASITDKVITPQSVIKTHLANPKSTVLEFSLEKGHSITKHKLYKATELFFKDTKMTAEESLMWRLKNIGKEKKEGVWKVGKDKVCIDKTGKCNIVLKILPTEKEAKQFVLKGNKPERFSFDHTGKRYGSSKKATIERFALLQDLNFVHL